MQKKLIALAVASVLAAPLAAQAGVEVYGQARMSLDFSNNDDTTVGNEDSALAVSSNKSRIGFKGDEDLGGGLKALWQFEQGVNFDTGDWNGAKRDTFIGLGGGFGTVLAGRINTPYKNATKDMDIFASTRGDYNAIMGAVNSSSATFNNRFDNSIQYRTPEMGGFKGALAYSVNRGSDNLRQATNTTCTTATATAPAVCTGSETDGYSLSGSYAQGPLFVTAAYEALNSYTAVLPSGADDAAAWKIGGSFTFGGMTTLGALWESADLGGTNNDRDAFYLNASHKMDAITFKAAFTMADEVGGVANTGATQFALGTAYALSKTTEAYALYTLVSNDSAARYSIEQVGGVVGKDVSSLSVGINHTFSSK